MKWHRHEGIYSIDYYSYISELKMVNPSFKAAFAMISLSLCIVLNNVYVSAFIIVSMALLNIIKGRLSFYEYLSLLFIPVAFMILAGVSIAFGISKTPLGEYNLKISYFYFYTSKKDIFNMFNIMLKALGAVSCLYMMTLSTNSGEIISVFRKIHVPKIVTELMNMIYRFIFIIMDVQIKMTNSAKSRLGYIDYRTSIKTFGNTLSNLFIVSLKKASKYYSAMEARCYDGDIIFLEEEKKLKLGHVFAALTYFLVVMAIFYLTR